MTAGILCIQIYFLSIGRTIVHSDVHDSVTFHSALFFWHFDYRHKNWSHAISLPFRNIFEFLLSVLLLSSPFLKRAQLPMSYGLSIPEQTFTVGTWNHDLCHTKWQWATLATHCYNIFNHWCLKVFQAQTVFICSNKAL